MHGKVDDHPEEAHGLVMSLIDSGFRNLAGPPSLDSCTRDIYAAETTFYLNVISIALGIAAAPNTCTRRASCMAICMRTTFCTAEAGMPCSAILAPRLRCGRRSGSG